MSILIKLYYILKYRFLVKNLTVCLPRVDRISGIFRISFRGGGGDIIENKLLKTKRVRLIELCNNASYCIHRPLCFISYGYI